MTPKNTQAPEAVIMVRPHHFAVNEETAADNHFQTEAQRSEALARAAYEEVTAAVEALRASGVKVHLFEDEGRNTPDSVFPNNWFSTHADGTVILYPMMAPSRRRERRMDIIEMLKNEYVVREVIDYSEDEQRGIYLEGTGAFVFDHLSRTAYLARSGRADEDLARKICDRLGYELMAFDASDNRGAPIYHTNVVMGVGTDYALIGLEMIRDQKNRDAICQRLEGAGREIVDLRESQISAFAGNVFELSGGEGRLLALSSTALRWLTDAHKKQIERHAALLPLDVPTIEKSGGSVRCMMAGIDLSEGPI